MSVSTPTGVDSPEQIKQDIQQAKNGNATAVTVAKASKSVPPKLKAFNKKEAEEATLRFHETKHAFRVQLLELHDRKAHKALGFTDDFSGFCAYAQEKLDIQTGSRSLQLQVESARVAQNVGQEIPIAIGRQLARVTPEKQAAIYNEISSVPDIEKSAAKLEPQIKRLVDAAIKEGFGVTPVDGKNKGGRPRREAQEATPEPQTATQVGDVVNLPSENRGLVSVAPGDTSMSLDAWQVEIAEKWDVESKRTEFECLMNEVRSMNETFYDEEVPFSVGGLFIAIVNLANAAGVSIEEQARAAVDEAMGVAAAIGTPEELAEAGYEDTSEEESTALDSDVGEFSEAGV